VEETTSTIISALEPSFFEGGVECGDDEDADEYDENVAALPHCPTC